MSLVARCASTATLRHLLAGAGLVEVSGVVVGADDVVLGVVVVGVVVVAGGVVVGSGGGGTSVVVGCSVVGTRFVVVMWRVVGIGSLVDGGGGGGSGGEVVVLVVATGDDVVAGSINTLGPAGCCCPLNAMAATVANPVAIAIPLAAHNTSRLGRASGSSCGRSIDVPFASASAATIATVLASTETPATVRVCHADSGLR